MTLPDRAGLNSRPWSRRSFANAQAGPVLGALVCEGDGQAVWYPVVEDAVAPLRALDLMRRQTEYLSAASAKRA
ncbi:hypothetical protein ABZ512_13085 [Nocardiopsis dassonvillei]|uniref:hypothetical protein n=1 Tax=Nocardiopsis dassonvillei TaxID=2014 RepID=UPI0008FCD438|nr:hypothetical protein [Nocardiopsis dassonvillei]APC36918.1 hypothetical protein A9R04_20580 [Nocardiopsis dassonvillei]